MIATTSLTTAYDTKMQYIHSLRTRPIAVETAKANEQHYEVGTGVLEACLGPRMKVSATHARWRQFHQAKFEGASVLLCFVIGCRS